LLFGGDLLTDAYHHVGKGHLNKYVDEFSFRYNSRTATDGRRAEMIAQGAAGTRPLRGTLKAEVKSCAVSGNSVKRREG
jgi:hypothetical protein